LKTYKLNSQYALAAALRIEFLMRLFLCWNAGSDVLFVSRWAPYSDFRGWLTTLEQGGHRFELTQKITAQFQIRVFF
jgi:hypothetical protein